MRQNDYLAAKFFARSHPFLQSPELTHGACSFVSEYYISLQMLVGRIGLRTVDLGTRLAPFENDPFLWNSKDTIGHTAVITEDETIIDFTYRQFNTQCEIPMVYPLVEAARCWRTIDINPASTLASFNPAEYISREKNIMAATDQVWKWREALDSPVLPMPRFKHHHGECCQFLGTFGEKDLYHCSQEVQSRVIVRSSSRRDDFISDLLHLKQDRWIREARWRANDLSLLLTDT
jgi:hypothetical protein